MEGHCSLQDKCAYNHKMRSNSQNIEIKSLHEEVKTLKAEVDTLKNNFKSVLSVRAEVESVQKYVKDIKDDIQKLTAANTDIEERIKHIEEEIKEETNNEGNSDTELNFPLFKEKVTRENSLKGQDLKCDNCDVVCETEMSMKNHIDSKHLFQNIERNESISSKRDCSLEGIEGIEDLFQLEVLDGEDIYACNVCDQGFDRENEIKKHILECHEEIILEIEKDLEKEPEINDESGDESFSN